MRQPPIVIDKHDDQPAPTRNGTQVSAHDQLVDDLARRGIPDRQLPDLVAWINQRKKVGLESYGTPLTAFNGRDGSRDALEESIDLCVYLGTGVTEGWCGKRTYSRAIALMCDVHQLHQARIAGR